MHLIEFSHKAWQAKNRYDYSSNFQFSAWFWPNSSKMSNHEMSVANQIAIQITEIQMW